MEWLCEADHRWLFSQALGMVRAVVHSEIAEHSLLMLPAFSLLVLAASIARDACLGQTLPDCSREAAITVDIPCIHLASTGLQVPSGQVADGAVR